MSRTEDDEADDITLPPPPADWAAQLLRFWFDEHGYQDWFRGGDAFDAAVREHFGEWHAALRGYPADHFLTDADTALAAVILFDQVPRNVHRGSAEAVAADALALAICQLWRGPGLARQAAALAKSARPINPLGGGRLLLGGRR